MLTFRRRLAGLLAATLLLVIAWQLIAFSNGQFRAVELSGRYSLAAAGSLVAGITLGAADTAMFARLGYLATKDWAGLGSAWWRLKLPWTRSLVHRVSLGLNLISPPRSWEADETSDLY
jgi:hypothetical protein